MASGFNQLMEHLVGELEKLPGIGRRSAERLAYHLLVTPEDDVLPLTEAITALKAGTFHCALCYNVSDSDPCAICEDPSRDRSRICIVETPKDLMKIERSGSWNGLYHVLHGSLSPLDGVDEKHLTLEGLLTRARSGSVEEIVIATGANLAGDATALHLEDLLQKFPGHVSRLARGLPTGGQLEYASDAMLADALRGRQSVHDPRRRGQAATELVLALVLATLALSSAWSLWSADPDPLATRTQDRETWWRWPVP